MLKPKVLVNHVKAPISWMTDKEFSEKPPSFNTRRWISNWQFVVKLPRRHSQTLFVPKGILMKNNLSSESIIAELSAAKVGIAGLHVLGAVGGGPGDVLCFPWQNAFEVAALNACTTSCSCHNFASWLESHNSLSNSSFKSDNVGHLNRSMT
jgi:hypothetical protein